MANPPTTLTNRPSRGAPSPETSSRQRLAAAAVIIPVVLIVVLPISSLLWPREMAQWQVAAAREKQLDKDYPAALELLDSAMETLPNDPSLRLARARLKLAMEDYPGALVELDRLLELVPSSETALALRSTTYQLLGENEKCIADCNTLVELYPHANTAAQAVQRASALNTRAYQRALCNAEIESAIEDSELSIQLLDDAQRMLEQGVEDPLVSFYRRWSGTQPHLPADHPLHYARGQFLDTRGYLYYLTEDAALLPKARQDLDQAIRACVRALPGQMKMADMLVDQRDFDEQRRPALQGLAILHYHRSLIYDRLGEEIKARQDLERAKTLGLDPKHPHADF